MRQGEPINGGITNDSFGAPPGSGIAILLAAGAGYAVVRRKRTRKNTMLLLACVALLGLTQCKKDEPLEPTNDGNSTRITLNVDNGGNKGSRVNVSGADVAFTSGDKILVAYDGKYVGTITHNGTNFSGNITITQNGDKPLYFYFLGNKDAGTLTAGTTSSCTVNISDQTGYPTLPVISFSASDQNFNGSGSYTASLHNKASLMKFNVSTRANSPIYITGMNNQVTIDFSKAASDGDNNGFTYDKEGNGIIMLKGGRGFPVEKWAIVLPQPELNAGHPGSTYAKNGSYTTFKGSRPKIHAIEANQYYHEGDDVINLFVNTDTDIVDLGDIIANKTIKNGETVIGTLAVDMQISIAAGATVTLCDVNINGSGTWSTGNYAGLNCLGDATIILADGTTNIVKGFNVDYPGIHVQSGSTLTIQGTGSLNASSNGYGAGIGGGYKGDNTIDCGNIIISGGTVTATGGGYAAGIGSGGNGCSCGNITISGGIVTATGGQYAAGIGSGFNESSCGTITIQNTVTRVTATKGDSAPNSIGAGGYGSCGTVTIGGVITGAISESPYTYPVPAPSGAINGKFSINGSGDQVYFSQGNLQYKASNGTWRFATNQYEYIGDANSNISSSYSDWIDLFGWGTSGWNCENTCYQPWDSNNSYGKYGPPGEYNLTGSYANSDWGYYNTISNGGNQSHQWRTLTQSEWNYVFNTRSTTSGIRYAKAQVNDLNGVILLPDNWSSSYFSLSNTNSKDANFSSNVISSSTWANSLEAHGAVFLPAAGYRDVTSVNDVGGYGTYWSASWRYNNCNAYYVHFDDGNLSPDTWASRHYGRSVRLVKDAN